MSKTSAFALSVVILFLWSLYNLLVEQNLIYIFHLGLLLYIVKLIDSPPQNESDITPGNIPTHTTVPSKPQTEEFPHELSFMINLYVSSGFSKADDIRHSKYLDAILFKPAIQPIEEEEVNTFTPLQSLEEAIEDDNISEPALQTLEESTEEEEDNIFSPTYRPTIQDTLEEGEPDEEPKTRPKNRFHTIRKNFKSFKKFCIRRSCGACYPASK